MERIVALHSDAAEIIWALGAQDRVVGISIIVDDDAFLQQAYGDLPTVGKWWTPDIEKIMELQPDVLICYGSWPSKEVLEDKLEPVGITVVRLDCYKMETLARDVAALGLMLGEQDRAWEYIDFYKGYLALVDSRVKNLEKPRVYIEGYSDYKTVSQGASGHEMCLRAGGNNIFADQPIAYPMVSSEDVVARQPEVIVKAVGAKVMTSGYGVTDTSAVAQQRSDIMNHEIRPGWDAIPAVQDGKVYIMAGDIYSGPRATIGILYMAKWFHPGEFTDLDPAQVHQEWLQKFYGVDATGVFVYPEQ